MAGLLIDANGDLFGTTNQGGSDNLGTVFEIKKTAGGYANKPTVVASFDGTNGDHPLAGLIADANGDLFGTTSEGGPSDDDIGTVFEITDSGFVTSASPPPTVTGDILWQNTSGQASIWDMSGNSLVGGGAVSPNPGPSLRAVGTGDFNHDGQSDILWQNTNTGQASIWEMDGNTLTGGGAVTPNPGPSWKAIGTGDFTGDGFSDDILWQNTNTGQASIWEMSGASLIGGGPVTPNPGTAWKAIGTGDFNKDGNFGILWQNTSTGQVSIWEMDGNKLVGGGAGDPQSWDSLASDRNRRFQPRRLFRHPFSEQEHGPSLGLGDGRKHAHRRRPRQRQSWAELARHRSGWRRRGHPPSKHRWPSHDLGDERQHDRRRRPGQSESRTKLAMRLA